MATVAAPALDAQKLEGLVQRAIEDVGAALNAALVVMGDRLGLYRALAASGALVPAELAARTGTAEPYVREWLNAQAANGYVEYAPDTGRYRLPAEHAAALADEDSPSFLPGLVQLALGAVVDSPLVVQAMCTGDGIGWQRHGPDVRLGRERFSRTAYAASLVGTWLPSLDGVVCKLERGGFVADAGCGHGFATILMARAFREATFSGSDDDEAAIATARRRAEDAAVADRVSFETAAAAAYSGREYDLVTMFDCLHNLGDPLAAARHVFETLDCDGTWLIVEPAAADRVEDNLTPLGRAYYGLSALLSTPAALAQEGGVALGAQAGETRIREIAEAAGFTRFRRAATTRFHAVFEVRP
jgi:SAM-dependent methyltransferase